MDARWRERNCCLSVLLCSFSFVAVPTFAATFAAIGPDGGALRGFAQATTDPNRLYCLPYHQGLFRSDDRGASWHRSDSQFVVLTRVSVSPFDAALVLVSDEQSSRIQRSTDSGVTFTAATQTMSNVRVIAFDPGTPQLVLAAVQVGSPGVYRSTDDGASWVASNSGLPSPDVRAIEFDPAHPGIALAGTSAGFARTTDGGQTWAPVGGGFTGISDLCFCTGTPTRVWAVNYPGGVLRSSDGGLTFAMTPSQPGGIAELAAHPTNSSIVVGSVWGGGWQATVEGIVRSTNGGTSWQTMTPPPALDEPGGYVEDFQFDHSDPSRVYSAMANMESTSQFNGLARSTNGGSTWQHWMNGIHAVDVLALARGGDGTIYARANAVIGMWRCSVPGGVWTQITAAPTSYGVPACVSASESVPGLVVEAAAGYSMDTASALIGVSTNQGDLWTEGYIPQVSLFDLPRAVAQAHSGQKVYLWVQTYGGEGWQLRTGQPPWYQMMTAYSVPPAVAAVVDPENDLRIFTLDPEIGTVRLTLDGGLTWKSATGLPSNRGVNLFLDPNDADRLTVVLRTAGAWRSEDSGTTWTKVLDLGSTVIVAADWDPTLDRFALATQQSGVYITGIGFVTDGLPTLELTSVLFEPASGKVLVGTKYASAYAVDAPDPTAVPQVDASTRDLSLRAHPNPFATSVDLDLTIGAAHEAAALEIFDVSGRRITTLHAGAAWSGTRTFRWDGRESNGARAAAGVYFARASVGGESRSTRVVLLDR